MLVKIVEKNGRNWDELLDPVLMAYCHMLLGESPLFVCQRCKNSTCFRFLQSKIEELTLESEYGSELFCEIKRIRELAKQKVKKAQYSQKHQYDKGAKESRIEVEKLVMLKVDPKFKLNKDFHGPYQVHGETSTNARTQPNNKPDAEVICVSLQCLPQV